MDEWTAMKGGPIDKFSPGYLLWTLLFCLFSIRGSHAWLPKTVFPGLAADMPPAQQPSESMTIRSQMVSVPSGCQASEVLSLCDLVILSPQYSVTVTDSPAPPAAWIAGFPLVSSLLKGTGSS